MIIFEEIKWKNFLSTGNHWTEIDFQKHQTNMVIGKNGAGKTTLLGMLLGLITPTKGDIYIFGKSLVFHLRRQINYGIFDRRNAMGMEA